MATGTSDQQQSIRARVCGESGFGRGAKPIWPLKKRKTQRVLVIRASFPTHSAAKSAASAADMAKKAHFCVAQMDKGSALSAIALLETEHFLPYHAPNPDTPQTLNCVVAKQTLFAGMTLHPQIPYNKDHQIYDILSLDSVVNTVMQNYMEAGLAPLKNTGTIKLYNEADFAGMRAAARLTAQCLDAISALVAPGVTTQELDDFVFAFACKHNAFPATLNYRGYTKSCCTSINHVVCHGIPNEKPLREGDIVNIDVTLVFDGWHGDSSRMYPVGGIKRAAERLVNITYNSLMLGIDEVRPGNFTGDIGAAIQKYAEAERCSVVRDFCGHGVGRLFHDAPNILHYGKPGEGVELKPGMIFTIEPMINLGRPGVKVLADGWTAVTRDRSLSAQFEHSVGVTETGCEIFTLSPAGYTVPPYH
jgi:methionyl aminopeptidase